MTYVPFKPEDPGYGDPRLASDVRNNLNALFNGDASPLRPRAQSTPDMSVQVAGCDVESFFKQCWIGMEIPFSFAGGNSPTIIAPSTNPRIALLTIDSSGTLAWTYGDEGTSPVPPNCPGQKIPICYVYEKTMMSKIVNFEDKDSNPNEGYIYRDIRPFLNLAGGGVPVGSIMSYGGASAPSGWLLCDGSAINRTIYATLFEVIGTTFGEGNGSTTFNLPNLKQRFPLGKADSGTGSTLGGTGGNIDHTHTGPNHTHPLPTTLGYEGSVANYQLTSGVTGAGGTGVTGGNNPPYQVVNYIIKY
jgi:microcystin-dependent protein